METTDPEEYLPEYLVRRCGGAELKGQQPLEKQLWILKTHIYWRLNEHSIRTSLILRNDIYAYLFSSLTTSFIIKFYVVAWIKETAEQRERLFLLKDPAFFGERSETVSSLLHSISGISFPQQIKLFIKFSLTASKYSPRKCLSSLFNVIALWW